MKILSIESASLVASAALIEDDVLLAECTSNYKKTHSETLLPMIDQVMKMTDTEAASLNAIAVSEGPGSFTGLRIGAATAKGLAYALDIPVVGVSEIDALAYGCFSSSCILCPILDARREQVYTGLYEFRDGEFIIHQAASALSLKEEIEKARELSKSLNKKILFLGDGLKTYESKIRDLLGDEVLFAPASLRYQRAANVGALGMKLFKEGKGVSSEAFLPVYLRKSQAEREREEKGLPLEQEAL